MLSKRHAPLQRNLVPRFVAIPDVVQRRCVLRSNVASSARTLASNDTINGSYGNAYMKGNVNYLLLARIIWAS